MLKKCICIYLEGVIGDRFSPIVLMTRLPQTLRPRMMPTPPYMRIQIGMDACLTTVPSWYINQSEITGPIALLESNAMIT